MRVLSNTTVPKLLIQTCAPLQWAHQYRHISDWNKSILRVTVHITDVACDKSIKRVTLQLGTQAT